MRRFIGLLLSLCFIGFATLRPVHGASSSVGTFCLLCGRFGVPDLILNLLLFAPLGFFLGRGRLSWIHVLGIGLLISAGIEVAQLDIPGRAPTVRDILVNAFGAGLGALISQRFAAGLLPGRRATVLMWLAVAGVGLAVGLTGWFHRFSPEEGTYYAHWVARQGHLIYWNGTVKSASVFDIPVPRYRQPASTAKALHTLLQDSVHVRVSGVNGDASLWLTGIFTVTTGEQEEILLVGSDGRDLILRVRRKAADLRMREPIFRFPGALAAVPGGKPLRMEFSGTPRTVCATVNGRRYCTNRPAAGSVWTLAIDSFRQPRWLRQALNALSLALLTLPFFLLWPAAPRSHVRIALAVLLVSVTLIPWGSGLATPNLWEWLGIAASAGLGFVLRKEALRSLAVVPR